jgi:methylmalonyl-CoA/ethylmalonyl-CoA epimerase
MSVGMRLHHLGVAVPAAPVLQPLLAFLGYEPAGSGVAGRFHCRCLFYQNGGALLELVEPLPGDGPIRAFTDANGTALHHIAFEVPDLMAAVRSAMRAGMNFQSGIERGALPGMYVAFCDRQSTGGILIELVEFRPSER